MKLRVAIAIFLFAVLALSRAQAQAALSFSGFNSNSYFDPVNSRMLGWQFSVTQQLDVLSVGWLDWGDDGLVASHQVGIWDVANTATPLASAIVTSGNGATLLDHFRYVTLGAPVTLQPGNTYRVAGFDPGNADAHVWDIVLGGYPNIEVYSFDRDPRITLISGGGIGPFASGFEYPATLVGDGRAVLMGPNLLLATVPEPATNALLMALGAMSAAAWFKKRRRAA